MACEFLVAVKAKSMLTAIHCLLTLLTSSAHHSTHLTGALCYLHWHGGRFHVSLSVCWQHY